MDEVFVIILVDREHLGRPFKMLSRGDQYGVKATSSVQRAAKFATERKATNWMNHVCNSGATDSFRNEDQDGITRGLYLMRVVAIPDPPAKRPPKPKREETPTLPLTF